MKADQGITDSRSLTVVRKNRQILFIMKEHTCPDSGNIVTEIRVGRAHLSHFRLKELALARHVTCGDFEANLAIQGVPDRSGWAKRRTHTCIHA